MVMVIWVYICDKISKNYTYVRMHTHVPVKTDDVPTLISWFSQCAMIMGDIIIVGSWVKATQVLFVLFLQLFVSPTLL